MLPMMTKLQHLKALFDYLSEQGYGHRFGIVHGVSPNGEMGRDVDLIVAKGDKEGIVKAAEAFFTQQGFRVGQYDVVRGRLMFVVSCENPRIGFEVDFAEGFSWSVFPLFQRQRKIETALINSMPYAIWEAFSKRILLQFLSGQIGKYARSEKTGEMALFEHEVLVVRAQLEKVFGTRDARLFLHAIENKNWAWLTHHLLRLRIRFLGYGMRHYPLLAIQTISAAFRFFVWKKIRPQFAPDVLLTDVGEVNARCKSWVDSYSEALKANYIFTHVVELDCSSLVALGRSRAIFIGKKELLPLYVLYGQHAESLKKGRVQLGFEIGRVPPEAAAEQTMYAHVKMLSSALE